MLSIKSLAKHIGFVLWESEQTVLKTRSLSSADKTGGNWRRIFVTFLTPQARPRSLMMRDEISMVSGCGLRQKSPTPGYYITRKRNCGRQCQAERR